MRGITARRLAAISAATAFAIVGFASPAKAYQQQNFCSGTYFGSGGASWCHFPGPAYILDTVVASADWNIGVGALRDGQPYSDMNYNNGTDVPGPGIIAYHYYNRNGGGPVYLQARLHSNYVSAQAVQGTFYW